MALRVAILGVLAVVVFCALFRLWALQVISGERYLEDANNNQIRSFGVIAPRGSIVDRDGTCSCPTGRAPSCRSGRLRSRTVSVVERTSFSTAFRGFWG